MNYKNLTLDKFQTDAINAIENNHSVVVSAPTGSGKTLIADYIIEKHKNDPKRIIYTAPIKALSNQKFKDFSQEYGSQHVGLITGDTVINPHGKVLVMTTEIYRNMVISKDEDVQNIAYVIFDEIHYINDIERGYVWEESIIYSDERIRFLCLSATIPNATQFSKWIHAIKKHPVETVISTHRHVPLQHLLYDYELGICTADKLKEVVAIPHYQQVFRKKGGKKEMEPLPSHTNLIRDLSRDKLPCLYFSFSRKDCQVKAQELARKKLFPFNSAIIQQFNRTMEKTSEEVSKLKSTRMLKETLPQGIAFHHAGLLPIVKEAVEDLFSQGLIKVLYTTETFAVGINMPAKTVCFDSLRKFDGRNFRPLNTKEYFQIAGRAGRRGLDTIGYVISLIYRPTFKYNEIKTITTKDVEPIISQFKLSTNTVLNIINQHTPEEIEKILRMSFWSYQKFGENYDKVPSKLLLARYSSIIRGLQKFGYVQDSNLTEKGHFASKIFADEITTGEIFATDFVNQFDEYQILLILACLVYEPRETNKFGKPQRNEQFKILQRVLSKQEYLGKEKKFLSLNEMSTIILPIYEGKTFFDLLETTNLLEGDLIRFFAQIKDRITQIRKASANYKVINKMSNCQGIIDQALAGIYML